MKFRDGYSDFNEPIEELVINNLVDKYKINLPGGWYRTDDNVTIESSDKDVVYIESDEYNTNCFYVCGNYYLPYENYKPVTITATKEDPATGDKKVAQLIVRRYYMYCANEKMSVYEGTSFKFDYKMVADKNIKVDFDSERPSVASISPDGIITAKKPGKTWISAFSERLVAGRTEVAVA